ncbi:hypothetical protein HNO88_003435 [Novosphingobium chloroacetimidivorans]|uniref:DUF2171 domain-containing protein n=1 Tax=Novosphingobium chloroacetimidivorans TaxID=1428314 RepID=A0A7W7KC46_9SPHN|nr:DUF2171 domain-containing protein [Novosphingobium chloroacetimidivorans]MBB4860097.1 hypothetical protein [Novosphingobium chloroacetimidivorans]
MTQQQRQSQSSSHASQAQSSDSAQDASLSRADKPDSTSPYRGPGDAEAEARPVEHVSDPDGPEAMEQPHFSEAQSTLGAFAPTERPGDPFAQPEDALGGLGRPTEQSDSVVAAPSDGQAFHTPSGTIHEGMAVVDSYGHTIGLVSSVDGERMRLSSTDPHDDGVAFLPLSLIDGIDGGRVLLAGRGDASFGMPSES